MLLTPVLAQPSFPLGTFDVREGEVPKMAWDRIVAFSSITALQNSSGQPAMSVPLFWNSNDLPIGFKMNDRLQKRELIFLANQLAPFLLLMLTSMVSACVSLPPEFKPQAFSELNKRADISNIPFYAQEKYQCGPATLAMALHWSGISVTPQDLVSQVYSPGKKGSLQAEMIGATRRYGRLAYTIDSLEALLKELSSGYPVIVLQNLAFDWSPKWHYALVLGYDLESATIVMNSGVTRRYVVDWTVFIHSWEKSSFWGLLVVPPGILPASASEASYLEAALGLEQVENWQAASTAYAAALERWPTSLGALMGEGNSRYALGDLSGAENAFRRAVFAAPENGAAHNNLAHVLAEQGRFEEALISVNQAIKAGGPQKLLFEQTRREIIEKRIKESK